MNFGSCPEEKATKNKCGRSSKIEIFKHLTENRWTIKWDTGF